MSAVGGGIMVCPGRGSCACAVARSILIMAVAAWSRAEGWRWSYDTAPAPPRRHTRGTTQHRGGGAPARMTVRQGAGRGAGQRPGVMSGHEAPPPCCAGLVCGGWCGASQPPLPWPRPVVPAKLPPARAAQPDSSLPLPVSHRDPQLHHHQHQPAQRHHVHVLRSR